MWYLILYAIFAIWVLVDAGKRKNNRIVWSLATLGLGPLVLPVYFAKRNLKDGETREGGFGWNVLKNFTLLWTLTILIWGIAGMVGVSVIVGETGDGVEQAGAVIGGAIGLGMIALLWFVVVVAALLLGMFLKKTGVVEKGPTGLLAANTKDQE